MSCPYHLCSRALKLQFLYLLPGVFVQNNNPAVADYVHVVIQKDCAAGRDTTDRSGQAQLVILIGEDIAAIASRQEEDLMLLVQQKSMMGLQYIRPGLIQKVFIQFFRSLCPTDIEEGNLHLPPFLP